MSAELAKSTRTPPPKARPVLLVATLLGISFGMLGLSFAAIPLYRLICQVTGIGGTTQRVTANATKTIDREIEVRFDANMLQGLPWEFTPKQRSVRVKLGETALVFYRARNLSNRVVKGQASFNVLPEIAGRYFDKIACFCFVEQTLQPGEEVEMPVTFYVDPAILSEPGAESIQTITLSYTFFELPEGSGMAVATPEKQGT